MTERSTAAAALGGRLDRHEAIAAIGDGFMQRFAAVGGRPIRWISRNDERRRINGLA